MATAAAASPSSVDGNSPSPYRRFSTRHRSRNAGASANGAAGSGAGMGETESPARPMQYGAFFKHFDDVPKEYQQTATASTFDEKLFEVNDKDEAAARFTDLYYALLFLGVMYFSTLPSWVLLSGNYLCCDQINSTARKACVQVGRSNDTFGCFDGIVNGTPVATTEIYQTNFDALFWGVSTASYGVALLFWIAMYSLVSANVCIHTTKRLSQVLFVWITIVGCMVSVFDILTETAGLAAGQLFTELAYVFLFSKMSHGLCWANAVIVILVNIVSMMIASRSYLDRVTLILVLWEDPSMAKVYDTCVVVVTFGLLILPLHYLRPQMRLSQSVASHLRDAISKMKSEETFQLQVLQNILPKEIIEQVSSNGSTFSSEHELCTIMFAHIDGSDQVSENAEECYSFLHDLICRLDDICPQFGVEKIKTIGATYMVASGIPEESESHADNIAMLAFAIAEEIQRYNHEMESSLTWKIGICSGKAVAGVIGNTKYTYDVFGDTVNTASRMYTHCPVGKIQMTKETVDCLSDWFTWKPNPLGKMVIKGKGMMLTYFLTSSAKTTSEYRRIHKRRGHNSKMLSGSPSPSFGSARGGSSMEGSAAAADHDGQSLSAYGTGSSQEMSSALAVLKTQRRRQRTFSSPCRGAFVLARFGFLSHVPEMANVAELELAFRQRIMTQMRFEYRAGYLTYYTIAFAALSQRAYFYQTSQLGADVAAMDQVYQLSLENILNTTVIVVTFGFALMMLCDFNHVGTQPAIWALQESLCTQAATLLFAFQNIVFVILYRLSFNWWYLIANFVLIPHVNVCFSLVPFANKVAAFAAAAVILATWAGVSASQSVISATGAATNVLVFTSWVIPAVVSFFIFDYRIERHNRRVFLQQQMVAFRYRKHLKKMKGTNSLVNKTALPESALETLRRTGAVKTSFIDASGTVLFADIVCFTRFTKFVSAVQLVKILNSMFMKFDNLAVVHGVDKIKTIGDCYVAASNVLTPNPDHAKAMIKMAQGMHAAMLEVNHVFQTGLRLRIGLHSGAIMAGIIGRSRIAFDIWGPTVDMANGMEEMGQAELVHISKSTYLRSKDDPELRFQERGKIMVHGKLVQSYFVENPPDYTMRGPGAHEKDYSKYIERSLFGAAHQQEKEAAESARHSKHRHRHRRHRHNQQEPAGKAREKGGDLDDSKPMRKVPTAVQLDIVRRSPDNVFPSLDELSPHSPTARFLEDYNDIDNDEGGRNHDGSTNAEIGTDGSNDLEMLSVHPQAGPKPAGGGNSPTKQ